MLRLVIAFQKLLERIILASSNEGDVVLDPFCGCGTTGWNKDYPKLQILTVEDLLSGKTVDLPPNLQTYKQASRVTNDSANQNSLSFE